MSSALDRAIEASRRQTNAMVDMTLRAVATGFGEASLIAGLASQGMSQGQGTLGRTVSLQQHTEQYRHFVGWVYACIRVIAQRIARQPIRIARVQRKADRKNSPFIKTVPFPYKGFHEDIDVLEGHPFLEALNLPNEIMTRWALIYVTIASLELTGKGYWWVYPAEEGSPFAGRKVIWPVPSSWIEPKHSKTRLYDKWLVRPEGTFDPVEVPGDQIVYFYYPDPANPLSAVSPLQAMARAVVADEAIAEAQRRAFANGIWPGIALVVGRNPDLKAAGMPDARPVMNRNQRAQILAAVKAAYRGVQHFDEPLILDGLIEDAKRITSTNREMDFMNSGSYTKERITQVFGVNPIVMGQIEGANRATAIAAEQHMLDNTINPKIELLSEILTQYAVPMFQNRETGETLIAYFEEASVRDPDQERLDRAQLMESGGISNNEIRTAHNMPPIHGGDVALVPSGWVPVHVIREDDPAPTGPATMPGEDQYQTDPNELPQPYLPPQFGPDGGDQPDDEGSTEPARKRRRTRQDASGRVGADSGTASLPFALRASRTLSRFDGEYRSCSRALGKDRTGSIFAKSHEEGERTLAQILGNVLAELGAEAEREATDQAKRGAHLGTHLVTALVSDATWVERIKAGLAIPVHNLASIGAAVEWELHRPRSAREMKTPLAALLGGPAGIPAGDRIPDSVAKRIEEHVRKSLEGTWIKEFPARVREELKDALEVGLAAGRSGAELVEDVRRVTGSEPMRTKSARIARSEATAALNAGQQSSQEELLAMGLARRKEWAAVLDEVTRTDHREANGQTVLIEDYFTVGGEHCLFPGQADLSPGQRYNCRCTSITITIADED